MELFKLLGTIAVDNAVANKEIDSTTQKAEASSGKLSGAFSKMGSAAVKIGGVAVKAAGVAAGAATAVGGALVASAENTREYRVEMGKLTTAFKTAGHSGKNAKNTYSELNAVLGDSEQAVEASNHLALLTDNQKELDKWTNICTGVYATFGASLPIEGLTEAANETAKVGQVTGPLADALNWAGISEDKFNEKLAKCSGEQERQKLIMETLDDTYKKAASTYKETNKDVIAAEKANQTFADAMAKLGAAVEPIINRMKFFGGMIVENVLPPVLKILKAFGTMGDDSEKATRKIEKGFEKLLEKLKESAPMLAGLVTPIVDIVMHMAPKVIESLLEGLISALPKLTTEFFDLVMKVLTILFQMLPQFLDAGAKIILSLVDGLMAQLPMLLGMVPQLIKSGIELVIALAQGLSDQLPTLIPLLVDGILNAVDALLDNLEPVVDVALQLILALGDGLIAALPMLLEQLPIIVEKIFIVLGNNAPKMWSAALKLTLALAKGLIDNIPQIVTFIPKMYVAIFNGIMNYKDKVISWFKTIFSAAWQGVKEVFANPSEFFGKVWKQIKSCFSEVSSWFKKTFDGAVSKISESFSGIAGIVKVPLNGMIELLNKFIDQVNKVKVPDWVPKVGGKGISIQKIPMLEEGGVLKKGQVGLLEGNGAEAVVPLEKNTGWLDEIASRLNGKTESADYSDKYDTMISLLQQLLNTDRVAEFKKALEGTDIKWNDRELGRMVKNYA